jgi:hypothetical protein
LARVRFAGIVLEQPSGNDPTAGTVERVGRAAKTIGHPLPDGGSTRSWLPLEDLTTAAKNHPTFAENGHEPSTDVTKAACVKHDGQRDQRQAQGPVADLRDDNGWIHLCLLRSIFGPHARIWGTCGAGHNLFLFFKNERARFLEADPVAMRTSGSLEISGSRRMFCGTLL